MPSDVPPAEGETLTPEEAFMLLSDETRVGILQELGDAWVDDWPGVVSYAELMDRIDVRDSGKFNYHLSKLTGRYVDDRKEGYKLNYPGLRLYRTIVAGTFTERIAIDEFPVDGECFECGGPLSATYSDTILTVRCTGCATSYFQGTLPPRGVVGRSREEVLRAVDRHARHAVAQLQQGVCPWCGSEPSVSIETPETNDVVASFGAAHDCYVVFQCPECGGLRGCGAGRTVLHHPAVVAFHHRHGIDLQTIRSWELPFVATGDHTDLVSEEPWQIQLEVPLDGEVLRLLVDDQASVVRTETFRENR